MSSLIRFVVALCVFAAGMSMTPAIAGTESDAKQIAVPSYNDIFACVRSNDKTRGTALRICRSLHDNPALDPEADNMFSEYLLVESEEPSLLIWSRVPRDAAKVELRFFRRENGAWTFLEERIFERKSSPPDAPIPMFTLDSVFGREYRRMQCQFYEEGCEVSVPSFPFPPRKGAGGSAK